MSDLTDELVRMAADGAGTARPMAVAEVIRRGKRRRTRSIARRSFGGLSVIGVSAAVILTGTAHAPVAPSSSSVLRGENTLTETTSSPAGTMTLAVRYRDEPHDKIKLLSLTFSGRTTAAIDRSSLSIIFGPVVSAQRGSRGGILDIVLLTHLVKDHSFAGSLPSRVVATINRSAGLARNEALRVSLIKTSQEGIRPGTIMTIGAILTR